MPRVSRRELVRASTCHVRCDCDGNESTGIIYSTNSHPKNRIFNPIIPFLFSKRLLKPLPLKTLTSRDHLLFHLLTCSPRVVCCLPERVFPPTFPPPRLSRHPRRRRAPESQYLYGHNRLPLWVTQILNRTMNLAPCDKMGKGDSDA